MLPTLIPNDVPIPRRSDGGFLGALRQLEIGQSVHFVGRAQMPVYSTMHAVKKETNRRFSARKTAEGYRVWRVNA